jgi:hypothetical protein
MAAGSTLWLEQIARSAQNDRFSKRGIRFVFFVKIRRVFYKRSSVSQHIRCSIISASALT